MDKIFFRILTKDFLRNHIQQFIDMCQRNMKEEYWDESNFLTELPGKWQNSFIVTNENEIILGFIIASEKAQSLHIHKFVVDKPFQSGGIGSQMLDRIVQQAKRPITLKVRDDNANAIAFYTKNGFVVNERMDGMYSMINSSLV